MSATISAVDLELRSSERGFDCSVTGSAGSVVILPLRSNCESDVINTFTSHSSGSDGRSEVRWLKKCPRSNLPDFLTQRVEHQLTRCSEDATNVSNLKTIALHLQMANHCDCRTSKLRATIGYDLKRHRIFVL